MIQTEEILLRAAAVLRGLFSLMSLLCTRRLSPILQAGGGREILLSRPTADSWKSAPPPPPPPSPLRNQAGPGLRRTEPHSALLIDKTPWKKRTANYGATLFQTELWDASRLKRALTNAEREVDF